MGRGRVLVVDDEATSRTVLGERLRHAGYLVDLAADGFKALGKVDSFAPDLVLSDLKMPGMDGIELLRRLRESHQEIALVLMTSFGAVETAVAAMKEGASDYLTKPLNLTQLLLVVARELERVRLRREARDLRARLSDRYTLENVVAVSESMKAACAAVQQVAPSRSHVLLTGEAGTGKELIAATIHQHGARPHAPFVKVTCSSLIDSALEAELFGSEGGSGQPVKDGRLWQADGGDLFLDDVWAMAPAVQVKLLRFLQEGRFERLGGHETLQADVRIIAASDRSLPAEIAAGRFREDLFYGLAVVTIDLPALRDRPKDIAPLAAHFLERFARANAKAVTSFSEDALARLTTHRWPGNVRELANAVERAVVFCSGGQIMPRDLPGGLGLEARASSGIQVPGATLEEIERWAILATLQATGGSTGKAAEILGISVRKIQYKLHHYNSAPRADRPVLGDADDDESGPC